MSDLCKLSDCKIPRTLTKSEGFTEEITTIPINVLAYSSSLIPGGETIGIEVNSKGVLVVGTNEIEGEDKKLYRPYEEAGIEQGDSITKINDEEINSTKKLIECISKSRD